VNIISSKIQNNVKTEAVYLRRSTGFPQTKCLMRNKIKQQEVK